MLSNTPNSTPFWLVIVFAAITTFGYPRIKRFVGKHVSDKSKQSFYSFGLLLVVMAVVVTLSVIFVP